MATKRLCLMMNHWLMTPQPINTRARDLDESERQQREAQAAIERNIQRNRIAEAERMKMKKVRDRDEHDESKRNRAGQAVLLRQAGGAAGAADGTGRMTRAAKKQPAAGSTLFDAPLFALTCWCCGDAAEIESVEQAEKLGWKSIIPDAEEEGEYRVVLVHARFTVKRPEQAKMVVT